VPRLSQEIVERAAREIFSQEALRVVRVEDAEALRVVRETLLAMEEKISRIGYVRYAKWMARELDARSEISAEEVREITQTYNSYSDWRKSYLAHPEIRQIAESYADDPPAQRFLTARFAELAGARTESEFRVCFQNMVLASDAKDVDPPRESEIRKTWVEIRELMRRTRSEDEVTEAKVSHSRARTRTSDPSVRVYLDFVSMPPGIAASGAGVDAQNEFYKIRDLAVQAKLVEIPPIVLKEIHDGIVQAQVARGPEDAQARADRVALEAASVEWPQYWPFQSTWFGLEKGVSFEPRIMRSIARRYPNSKHIEQGVLKAILVGRSGVCYYIFQVKLEGRGHAISAIPQYLNGKWTDPIPTNAPWVLTAISYAVMDHRTVILERSGGKVRTGMRREAQKISKILIRPFTPPHFYRIQLRQRIEWERVMRRPEPGPVKVEYGHRWDVRDHERVRVQRGLLPLDPKIKKRLLRRRQVSGKCYRIYDQGHPLRDDDAHRLNMRGFKRFDPETEWVAVLVTEIGEYVKGPEGKPYIPGKRVLDPDILDKM
tara:strand:+ start:360 stop:1994 length:1635 start_codon:yes stop_codon:yes gene_type:complete